MDQAMTIRMTLLQLALVAAPTLSASRRLEHPCPPRASESGNCTLSESSGVVWSGLPGFGLSQLNAQHQWTAQDQPVGPVEVIEPDPRS